MAPGPGRWAGGCLSQGRALPSPPLPTGVGTKPGRKTQTEGGSAPATAARSPLPGSRPAHGCSGCQHRLAPRGGGRRREDAGGRRARQTGSSSRRAAQPSWPLRLEPGSAPLPIAPPRLPPNRAGWPAPGEGLGVQGSFQSWRRPCAPQAERAGAQSRRRSSPRSPLPPSPLLAAAAAGREGALVPRTRPSCPGVQKAPRNRAQRRPPSCLSCPDPVCAQAIP